MRSRSAFSSAAVYYGSQVAAGFGRDVRAALFHQVTDFSAREVAHFGAPSLITRVTNDVTQVQTLVQMTCTLLIAAPITAIGGTIFALQEDVQLTWILAVAIPVLILSIGNVIARMVPTFRVMQERIDDINRVLREQITGIRVVRAFVREPYEQARFDESNEKLTKVALRGGRLMGLMFPTVMVIVNLSSVAVVWFGADLVNARRAAARLAHRLPAVPHADPDGGHARHVHGGARAPRVGQRRAGEGSARHAQQHRDLGRHTGRGVHRRRIGASCATPGSAIRAPSTRCCRA